MKGKTICKTLGLVLLALLILVVLYVVYVLASYHRIGDQSLSVMHCSAIAPAPMEDAVETGTVYRVTSANVGFGAYSADYSFFMDGGRESRARSRQAVDENMRGIVAFVEALSPDFALFQEVDTDGTRSWHIDETAYLDDALNGPEFDEVFAQNYDSPYLFYPLIQPHGANQSGIVTLSRHPIASAARRELPVESGFMKLLDLDRCYSVSRIPEGTIPAGLTLVAPFDETAPAASCRTASEPYSIETTFRLTVDGFLVSDNVEVVDSAVLDAGFLYSDHNPVWMDFKLN